MRLSITQVCYKYANKVPLACLWWDTQLMKMLKMWVIFINSTMFVFINSTMFSLFDFECLNTHSILYTFKIYILYNFKISIFEKQETKKKC
jgi:hypothetical protein